jgi:NurA-like 5'-3' nuclease
MVRTKTQIRGSKSKGSQYEMDCAHSLRKLYPDLVRHGKEGFQKELDLETKYMVFECKRLKGISWNQAETFFTKLEEVSPLIKLEGLEEKKDAYLLFQSNRQPCLVMHRLTNGNIAIQRFEDVFNTPFEKHTSTRRKK